MYASSAKHFAELDVEASGPICAVSFNLPPINFIFGRGRELRFLFLPPSKPSPSFSALRMCSFFVYIQTMRYIPPRDVCRRWNAAHKTACFTFCTRRCSKALDNEFCEAKLELKTEQDVPFSYRCSAKSVCGFCALAIRLRQHIKFGAVLRYEVLFASSILKPKI